MAVARELIAQADVVVENFSTGVMERFGLDYESCRKLNPTLIYCSVSAYGREGAFADRLGFDPIAQAESGFVSMNGYADREGVRALSPVMDISTAMMACNAILGALVARERTGEGQAIEVALFDNAVLMTGYATLQHLFTGKEPQRHGNTSPDTCPSGVFQAQRPLVLHQLRQRQDLPAPDGAGDRSARPGRRSELRDRAATASRAATSCSRSSARPSRSSRGRTGRRGCATPACPAARCAPSARRSVRPKRASAASSRASRIRRWAGCRTSRCRSATRSTPVADPVAGAGRRPAHGARCCARCWATTTTRIARDCAAGRRVRRDDRDRVARRQSLMAAVA